MPDFTLTFESSPEITLDVSDDGGFTVGIAGEVATKLPTIYTYIVDELDQIPPFPYSNPMPMFFDHDFWPTGGVQPDRSQPADEATVVALCASSIAQHGRVILDIEPSGKQAWRDVMAPLLTIVRRECPNTIIGRYASKGAILTNAVPWSTGDGAIIGGDMKWQTEKVALIDGLIDFTCPVMYYGRQAGNAFETAADFRLRMEATLSLETLYKVPIVPFIGPTVEFNPGLPDDNRDLLPDEITAEIKSIMLDMKVDGWLVWAVRLSSGVQDKPIGAGLWQTSWSSPYPD